jgi:hypothetical protein
LIYQRFFNAPEDCFSEEEKKPKVEFMSGNLMTGFPFIQKSLSKVDDDVADDKRTYPTD